MYLNAVFVIVPFSVIPNRNIIVDVCRLSAFCSEALHPTELKISGQQK